MRYFLVTHHSWPLKATVSEYETQVFLFCSTPADVYISLGRSTTPVNSQPVEPFGEAKGVSRSKIRDVAQGKAENDKSDAV